MSFISNGLPAKDDNSTIENDGFFPDLEVKEFRDIQRVDGAVTAERLKEALIAGILEVNQTLLSFKLQHKEKGYLSLYEIPNDIIAGLPRLFLLYRRAVFEWAKADLAEKYQDYDSSGEGDKKAEKMSLIIDNHKRNSRNAVRDLLGQTHSHIELI